MIQYLRSVRPKNQVNCTELLRNQFKLTQWPDKIQIDQISAATNKSPHKIKNWFRQERFRQKKKKMTQNKIKKNK